MEFYEPEINKEVKAFAYSYFGYELASSFCALTFIILVSLDVWKSFKRKASWIPGQALVLSALTIQLLLFIDHLDVNINSNNETLKYIQLTLLVEKQLLIDSRRVMMCVFIAYLLPGMVTGRLKTVWGNVGTLALAVIAHMAYEAYFLLTTDAWEDEWDDEGDDSETWNLYGVWLIPSYIVLSLAMILLVVLLSCAVIAGKGIRNIVSQKVPLALSSCCNSTENRSCKNIEDHVLRCWIVVRVSQPDYIMARSVFSAFAGVVVTICVVFLVVKWICVPLPSYPEDITVYAVQFAFLVVGSIVVVFRWLTAVFFFPKDVRCLLCLEDFWTRRLVQQKVDLRGSRLYLSLTLTALLWVQKFMVLLSKVCWSLSQFVFGIIRPFIMCKKNKSDQFSKYEEVLELIRMPGENADSLWRANESAFQKTRNHFEKGIKDGENNSKELIDLIGRKTVTPEDETPASLPGTPEDEAPAEDETPASLPGTPEDETPAKDETPASLPGTPEDETPASLPEEKNFIAVGKNSWKMRGVSLIHFMIHFCDETNSDVVKDCMEGYRQALCFMDMVDSSDPEAKLVSQAADNEFYTLEKVWKKQYGKKHDSPKNASHDPLQSERQQTAPNKKQLEQKIKDVDKLWPQDGRELCDIEGDRKPPWSLHDSHDLKTIAARISLYKTWNSGNLKSISENAIQTWNSGDLKSISENVIQNLRCLLANVISHCLEEVVLDKAITKNCNKWAEEGNGNKIFEAAYIAGKAKGVRPQQMTSA